MQSQTQAEVIVLGAPMGVGQLTYAIPGQLDGRVAPGHRVLVPIRSRRLTGVVTRIGAGLSADGDRLKPILELLDPTPLFDRAHLELLEFMASYYLAPLADAYRAVIPATLRVESRATFVTAHSPDPLAAAAFSPSERAIAQALARRPMSLRALRKLGDEREIRASLSRMLADGLIARRDATRGRHRDVRELAVRRNRDVSAKPQRSTRHKRILELLDAAPDGMATLRDLEAEVPAARTAVRIMARRGLVVLEEIDEPIGTRESPHRLSDDQAAAFAAAAPAVARRKFETFVLFGVTGSGKTELYMRWAAHALAQGRRALVLVPEIALADQIVKSFRSRFGALVAIAHSEQSVSERWASWTAALSGAARIMIGPRSAIFAPLRDLGLIVVDEEHDPAYKQEEGIRYNARDLAVALGRISSCPVVLGSATPSAESYANARRGRYRLLTLSRRIEDRPLAQAEVIDLRADARRESAARRGSQPAEPAPVPLSASLIEALRQTLTGGGQSIVFLNRRGYHNVLQCHLCGIVIACPNCSVGETFHLRDRTMRCHYCGHLESAPDACPECHGFGLEGQGFGTERLVAALAERIPDARIDRMDSDTSSRRGGRGRLLDALARGEIDILVGTQMVTKGFDFPRVTLVGVVLADLALNLPDFRSAERTFQLLTQVAGRAGRGERAGRVLIQTYAPHHYSIKAAKDQDYLRFMRRELELRRELMYPPFARLALIRIEGTESASVRQIANQAAATLGRLVTADSARVLGPAPAPIERIKGRYRWQILLKSPALSKMRDALVRCRDAIAPAAKRNDVRIVIDIDPVNML